MNYNFLESKNCCFNKVVIILKNKFILKCIKVLYIIFIISTITTQSKAQDQNSAINYAQHPLIYCEETEEKEKEKENTIKNKLHKQWKYLNIEIIEGKNTLIYDTIQSNINTYEYLQHNYINNPVLLNIILHQGELLITTYQQMNNVTNIKINNILTKIQQNNKSLLNITSQNNIWSYAHIQEGTNEILSDILLTELNINIRKQLLTNIEDNQTIIKEKEYLTPNICKKYNYKYGNNINCILDGELVDYNSKTKEILHHFTTKISEMSIQSQYFKIPEFKLTEIIRSTAEKTLTDTPIVQGFEKLSHFLNTNLREVRKNLYMKILKTDINI